MKAKPSQINRKDTYDHDKCTRSGCPDQWLEGLSEVLKHGELAGVAFYCGLLRLPHVSEKQCREALELIANDKLSSKRKVTGAPPARPWRENDIEKIWDKAGYEAALVCFRLLNKPRQLTNKDFQLLHYYIKTKEEFTGGEPVDYDPAEMSESALWEKGHFKRVSNPEAKQRAVDNLKPKVRPHWEQLQARESVEAQIGGTCRFDGNNVLELLDKVDVESTFKRRISDIFGRPNKKEKENGRFTQDVKRHSRV